MVLLPTSKGISSLIFIAMEEYVILDGVITVLDWVFNENA